MQYRITEDEYTAIRAEREKPGSEVGVPSSKVDDSHLDFWVGARNATIFGIGSYLVVLLLWQVAA